MDHHSCSQHVSLPFLSSSVKTTDMFPNRTVYAIATVDSLYPTYVYIRLGGDPDRMSTWCLKIGLKLKREKEESSTRIFTPQESNYGDNEEK